MVEIILVGLLGWFIISLWVGTIIGCFIHGIDKRWNEALESKHRRDE